MSTSDENDQDDSAYLDAQDHDLHDADSELPSHDKMDILSNITLEIRVEIGRAKIKITELLNLKKGMVLELDQLANEPLSIYANDKVIAKGTIISANGRYCVRIV